MQDIHRKKINGTEQKSLKKRTHEHLIKLFQSSLEFFIHTKSKTVIEHIFYAKHCVRDKTAIGPPKSPARGTKNERLNMAE